MARARRASRGAARCASWLYTIATNACLKAIERRPKRVLPVDYGPATDPHEGPAPPLVESVWIEPYPDERLGLGGGAGRPEARYEQRESVELAFIAALQHLPARQRAVLILRDVLGFSGAEVADALETTPAGGLQRAAARAQERRRSGCPSAASRPRCARSGDERAARDRRRASSRAWERGDVDAVAAMLAQDAIDRDAADADLVPRARRGRRASCAARRWRPGCAGAWSRTRASGQLAFAFYLWSDEARQPSPPTTSSCSRSTARGSPSSSPSWSPQAFRHFGLPAECSGLARNAVEDHWGNGSNRPAQKWSEILSNG